MTFSTVGKVPSHIEPRDATYAPMLRMAAVAAFSAAGGSVLFRYATSAKTWRTPKTRKEAKCSDVITALKPTTGTEAASRVPKMICRCLSKFLPQKLEPSLQQ